MKNDLAHLNDALHQTLDALIEETDHDGQPLDAEALANRIRRAGAVSAIAGQIIGVGRLALDAERLRIDGGESVQVPALISAGKPAPTAPAPTKPDNGDA